MFPLMHIIHYSNPPDKCNEDKNYMANKKDDSFYMTELHVNHITFFNNDITHFLFYELYV
jgi:hypothetical protein